MADFMHRKPICSRRTFVQAAAVGAAGTALGMMGPRVDAAPKSPRAGKADGVEVLNPRGRVPLSFVIDDSTCHSESPY